MAKDYRVQLDIYNGPLDLLLYLIKRDELNIYDIPIARVAEQFVRYLEVIQLLDLSLAGDFLVMASTLMEIKSRMLLPRPAVTEEGEDEDPRMELVRQLIEYKKFKDAAGSLSDLAEERKRLFERLGEPLPEDEAPPDTGNVLKDVDLWVLLDAFSKLMRQTMADATTRIVYDDTPVHVYAQHVLERVQAVQSIMFFDLFRGASSRSVIIGIFLALLELIRQRKLRIEGPGPSGEIRVLFVESPPPEATAASTSPTATQTPPSPAAPEPQPPPAPAAPHQPSPAPSAPATYPPISGPTEEPSAAALPQPPAPPAAEEHRNGTPSSAVEPAKDAPTNAPSQRQPRPGNAPPPNGSDTGE